MATKWPQGEITPNQPATVLGGNNISGVYTLDQLNRLNADFGPQMQRSLRFRSSASAYLNRTPSVAGNRRTWTWSGWVKRGAISQNAYRSLFGGYETTITFYDDTTYNSQIIVNLRSSGTNVFLNYAPVFRDTSAWYHFVFACDTTQATASNRFKFYVNGVQITSAGSLGLNYPTQNWNTDVNTALLHTIGVDTSISNLFDGYMAEVNFIDGQALDPSYFGKYNGTTGVWQPIFYTGSYGTNGFRLTFANTTSTTTLGYDSSPNGNNWTANNISLTAGVTYDSMLDVPTNWTSGDPIQARGNYAVLNPLNSSSTISDGNLSCSSPSSQNGVAGSIAIPSTGKFYGEFTQSSASIYYHYGIMQSNCTVAMLNTTQNADCVLYRSDGAIFRNTGSGYTQIQTVASSTANDVIAFAVDADALTLQLYKNGSTLGTAISLTSGINYVPWIHNGNPSLVSYANFGQRPFAYTPPTGFKALNTQNLPGVSIQNGASFMAATLYTGNGSTQSINNAVNGTSFQPDFVWVKSRSAATDHALYDVIRGTQNRLESNTTDAAVAPDNGLTAFGTSGFTVNTLAQVNTNAATYVGWQWKANGTAVTNTSGTITSQVSANTTAGFSVVSFTSQASGTATIGHGLGVAPSMMIVRKTGVAFSWYVYHVTTGAGNVLFLNGTNATTADVNIWGNTAPTSTLFTVGSSYAGSSATIAYCFAAIAGYSAFGSYTGNGSTDGPFVYCGFRPRFVLLKRTDTTTDWFIWDTSRNTYNLMNTTLFPNSSLADYVDSNLSIDGLSNGFKLRSNTPLSNPSGGIIIYAAFAENPFKYSLAR